jgi:hypothetical protein
MRSFSHIAALWEKEHCFRAALATFRVRLRSPSHPNKAAIAKPTLPIRTPIVRAKIDRRDCSECSGFATVGRMGDTPVVDSRRDSGPCRVLAICWAAN